MKRGAGWLAGTGLVSLVGFAVLDRHPKTAAVEMGLEGNVGATVDRVADRLHVSHSDGGRLYAIEDHFLYVSEDTGHSYQRLGKLSKPGGLSPQERLREAVARTRVTRRIRRYSGPKSMAVLASGTILVFYDQIYRSTDGGRTFAPTSGTSDLAKPFPSSVGIAVGPGDTIYYGEYETTARPREVKIMRGTEDGSRWTVAHTFPAGELFHVHSVSYDPYRKGYWIAAGDQGTEPRLMYTADGFRTFHTVGCCAQHWRLVDLIITPEALYWGSDDDQHQPAIFRFDPAAGTLARVAELDNPSYHAARLADGTLAISTTHEPYSPYTKARTPPAAASLWISRDGWRWARVLSLSGDRDHRETGLRPQLQIPSGDPLPALFVTPWHTEEWEFATLRFRLDPR